MIFSYVRLALRYLLKSKAFSLINILGLAVGMACSVMLFLHVTNELSYDRHFRNAKDIYRLAVKSSMGENQFEAAVTGGPLAITLQQELPEVIAHTRLREGQLTLISSGEHAFYEEGILYADSNFFEIFNYPLVQGNPAGTLDLPRTVVLKESAAIKFFGTADVVGRHLKWNNKDTYTVTAVIKDFTGNSHLNFDILVSFSTLYENERFSALLQSYFAYTTLNYIKVTHSTNPIELEQKIGLVVDKYMGDGLAEYEGKYDVFLQPLTKIYLHSDLLHEMKTSSDMRLVYIFTGIGFLLLVIACINFINLSTARSLGRVLEIGMRKVFGANRGMVFRQFMGESILSVFISAIIAIAILYAALPLFNRFSGNDFSFSDFFRWEYLVIVISGVILTGFIAGIYPSLYLSGYDPMAVFKRAAPGRGPKSTMRNFLVVAQFMIAVFLLSGTFLINRQLNFLQGKDLGIDQNNIAVISLRDRTMVENYSMLKSELSNVPGVTDVTGSSAYLGNFQQRMGFYKQGSGLKDMVLTLFLQVDQNYLDFYQTKIIQGRSFFENSKVDSNAIVINEAYLEQLGWDEPLGKIIYIPGNTEAESTPLRIIGVVKNFNYASLHQDVKPIIIMNSSQRIRYLSVRISPENLDETLQLVSLKWEKLYPAYPFEYFIQKSVYDDMYKQEVNMRSLMGYFSLLGLFIAMLGLMGLSAYSTAQRTREIGIRKVLGSSVNQILTLITLDFSKWIALAVVVAIPIAYFSMDKWLNNFAFHTSISAEVFIFPGLIVFLVAFLTILVQAYRASYTNPVDSLHYE